MIKPKTHSEILQYSTVRIETEDGSVGTGFFFQFSLKRGNIPIIVTNKHVVGDGNKKVNLFLHSASGGNIDEDKINIKYKLEWIFHKDKDLCFCFAGPLFHYMKNELKKEIFFAPITEELIFDNDKLSDFGAVEDIIMVGYPNGLWDEKNNLPLFRKGITASHLAIDFNEESMGAVDMACFPGSSGSPIFILNENGYRDKKGNYYLGASRIVFLGILFKGPQIDARGKLIIEDLPTQKTIISNTPIMINMGYYIKSIKILDFKSIIEEKIKKD
jgi:hypothetical protein